MIAVTDFVDLQDSNYLYHAGDKFPRKGAVVDEARIAELSGANNKLGRPVIGEPEETVQPKKRRKRNAD